MNVLLSSLKRLSEAKTVIEQGIDIEFEEHDKRLFEFLQRAQSLVSNPKRPKRLPQIPSDAVLDRQSNGSEPSILEVTQSLRPIRTAKTKASENLKEHSLNIKMRNDNESVVISQFVVKKENDYKRESKAKESLQREISSVDKIASEANLATQKRNNSKSVEIIPTKAVQIDLCDDDDDAAVKMPPPMLPVVKAPKKATKQKKDASANDSSVSTSSTESTKRTTRSKIKKEPADKCVREIPDITVSDEADGGKKKTPRMKKPHLPIFVKVERESLGKEVERECLVKEVERKSLVKEVEHESLVKEVEMTKPENTPKQNAPKSTVKVVSPARSEQSVYEDAVAEKINANDTFNVPAANETFNVPADEQETPKLNETVIIERNIMRESIMTEDNDEDMPLAYLKPQPPPKYATLPSRPEIKTKPGPLFKKGEVFNVYEKSPVKKKVEAFEKHAMQSMHTPDKTIGMVRGLLAKQYLQVHVGKVTPSQSKIALPLIKANTPSNQPIKITTASSAIAPYKAKPLSKKLQSSKSLSTESLDEIKKTQMNEEKRKARDEKARMVQQKREQLEKETAENAMKILKERDERFAKTMQEREEKQRIELLKKKALKEKQEKKYQEELRRKEKMALIEQNKREIAGKESLQKSMHKQQIQQKIIQQTKEEVKNAYNFDILNTDDSTDDESKPVSAKRPPPPAWSKNPERKKNIEMQTYINSSVIDTLFSVHPLSVDLKEIFPKIDSRKLIRNSSAVWNTPPRMSQVPY